MKTLERMSHSDKINSFLCLRIPKTFKRKKQFITDGYIKVNLKGTSRDGIELNEFFIADKFVANDAAYSNSFWINHKDHNQISFNLRRVGGKDFSKRIFISFCLVGDSISDENVQIGIYRTLDKNKVLDLALYLEDNAEYPNPNPITNIKFDQKTQIVSGDFKFEDNRLSAIKISGDFKLKLMQRVL